MSYCGSPSAEGCSRSRSICSADGPDVDLARAHAERLHQLPGVALRVARWWRSRASCRRGRSRAAGRGGPSRGRRRSARAWSPARRRRRSRPSRSRSRAAASRGRGPGCCRPPRSARCGSRGRPGRRGSARCARRSGTARSRDAELERDRAEALRAARGGRGSSRRSCSCSRGRRRSGRGRCRRRSAARRSAKRSASASRSPFSQISAWPSQARSVVDSPSAGGGVDVGRDRRAPTAPCTACAGSRPCRS